VRYELKTPYDDGTTQVLFELLDFIASIEDPVVIRKILAHLNAKAIRSDLLPQVNSLQRQETPLLYLQPAGLGGSGIVRDVILMMTDLLSSECAVAR
jgi:hypothetical protein